MFLASCQFGFFEFYGNLPDLFHIKLHFKLEGVASCPLMSFCTYKRHILKTNKNQFIIRHQRDWMCVFSFGVENLICIYEINYLFAEKNNTFYMNADDDVHVHVLVMLI